MEGRLYTPGAGHRPPVMAGRDELLQGWITTCNDVDALGRVAADDLVVIGPRGVGKTSLVEALGDTASKAGFEVLALQAVQGEPRLVESLVETAWLRIAEERPAWVKARDAFSRVAGVSVSVMGVSGSVSTHRTSDDVKVSRDPQVIAMALADVAQAAHREDGRGGLMVSVDELQVAGPDLPLLAAALHRLNTQHPSAQVLFAGTGLPNTERAMDQAGVTHPSRLFNIMPLPAQLSEEQARYALTAPATQRGVTWMPAAQDLVIKATGGYPAHLQMFAHHVWRAAEGTTITEEAAKEGVTNAAREFERRTMVSLWAQLSPRQREYLTAVSVAGGVASSRQVSEMLQRTTQQDSMTRSSLIESGSLYSTALNRIALAMPLVGHYAIANHDRDRDPDTPTATVDEMRRRLPAHDRLRDLRDTLAGHQQTRPQISAEPDSPHQGPSITM